MRALVPRGRGAGLKLKTSRGCVVGAAEFSRKLLPGSRCWLCYPDDPGIWCEALNVCPCAPWGHHILTPDGDEYSEDTCSATGGGPSRAVLCDLSGNGAPDMAGGGV